MKRPDRGILILVMLLLAANVIDGLANDSTIVAQAYMHESVPLRYRTFDNISLPTDYRHPQDPIIIDEIVSDSVLVKRAHAHALLQEVLAGQRFLESLDALSEIDLPVGIVKSGGAFDYTVLVDRLEFSKEGALMDIYVSLSLPQTGNRIAFHGRVPLSASGGISGTAKVYLLGDHKIILGPTTLLTLEGEDRSYVEFDCSGFLGVFLQGHMQLSTDLLQPEDEQGELVSERLQISFATYAQSLHDIVTKVTIPPFQIKGLPGFGFRISDAFLDWSDIANPPDMVFPDGYSSPFVEAGLTTLWQGVFLRDVHVRLPTSFARQGSTERISLAGRAMILDERGLTGSLHVENVFRDGDMNGWSYSLDAVSLGVVTNYITTFSLRGMISIPVIKGKDGKHTEFAYTASRGANGDYIFSVSVDNDLRLDLWIADMKLAAGSSIVVTEKKNKFYPSAHLNGELSIQIDDKGPRASFNSIRFEGMVINSEAPFFQPGTFGFGREGHHSSVLKYPVVFDNIRVKAENDRVGIAFDLIINITGNPDDESFAGKAGLVIWGIQGGEAKRDVDGKVIGIDRRSWEFHRVELTGVRISIKKPKIIELTGEIRFFDDDATYGEGFKGALKGTIHTIKVEAQALFGRTDTFRYWYADALVELKTGIPIVPGVLSAFGFGGGYYSRMKQISAPVEGTLGRSPSGITYVPDENTTGIRAIVLIGTPRPEAMRGDVALEVSLNRHGGINSVTFTGNANFMSLESSGAKQIKQLAAAAVTGNLTEKLSSLTRGQVYGSVRLHFDNVNDIFHGNLEIYINVAGGVVRGVSEGNKAGWAVLHFEKSDWYIHIGTPDQPLGLEVARIFKAKSYFMLGKNLPASPPPPSQVSEILGNVDLDYMRDLNALESGMGIAFGLHFLVDTGDLTFLMFYGRFSAGTGLDFMLKDYGSEYHCAGSSGAMGINGWYANGQAYAFVMGKIGIKVNLRFYKGKYEILSIGAAAILQAKGPNPFWMKGMVGGYYRILGGLVKGSCRFEVTVGKDCKPVKEENLLEEINMIADMTPANSSLDVNVFNAPQVAFNIPVGETFEIRDLENRTHSFRAVLDEFIILDGYQYINGVHTWNEERDVVAFNPSDLLPAEKTLKARAKLSFEEKVNGVWTKVKFEGKVVIETAEWSFQTGRAPDFIPENNIAFAYPLPYQANFHPQEYSQGFIQLLKGQPYLFKTTAEWEQKIRMTELSSGESIETTFNYNQTTRRVTFAIPEGLRNSSDYRYEIINKPKAVAPVDQNSTTVEQDLTFGKEAGSATLTTQSLEGNLDMLDTRSIFNSSFHTSNYNTFSDKMRNINLSPTIRLNSGINIFRLTAQLIGPESFDASEAATSAEKTLIQPVALLDRNTWYDRYVFPLVYHDYPLLGWMKVRRPNVKDVGVPPIRDIYFENIKPNNPANSSYTRPRPFTNEYIVYNLGESVASDFYDLQRHAVNYAADHPLSITPRLETLILRPLPYIRYGSYRLKLNYVIPGIDLTTSSYELEMFNRIPDND